MQRRHLSNLLKILITVAGSGLVIRVVPISKITDVLADVGWYWLLLVFVAMTISLVIRAFRWMLLLRGLGVSLPFTRLVSLYFVGNFFNAFLFSGVGGDAVRILEVSRDIPAGVAAGTVVVDRLTGLLMLFAMALIAMPFRPEGFPADLTLIISIVCASGLLAGFLILQGSLVRRLGKRLPERFSPVGEGVIGSFFQAIHDCGWQAITQAFGVSVIFNLLLAAWWASAGHSLDLGIGYSYYLLVVPIMSVALMVPSISGLGVRELIAPALFSGANVARSEAVALSLLVFFVSRLVSLLGAPIYLASMLPRYRSKHKRGTDRLPPS